MRFRGHPCHAGDFDSETEPLSCAASPAESGGNLTLCLAGRIDVVQVLDALTAHVRSAERVTQVQH